MAKQDLDTLYRVGYADVYVYGDVDDALGVLVDD
jgi:hypothetical protein